MESDTELLLNYEAKPTLYLKGSTEVLFLLLTIFTMYAVLYMLSLFEEFINFNILILRGGLIVIVLFYINMPYSKIVITSNSPFSSPYQNCTVKIEEVFASSIKDVFVN